MSRNLSYQLQYLVHQSTAFGESKYDERHKAKGEKKNHVKTYSHKTFSAWIDVAKALGKIIQNNYPDTKLAKDITPAMANAFLESRANNGCREATLAAYASDVRVLFRLAEDKWHAPHYDLKQEIKAPEPRPELDPLRTAQGMNREDFEKILATQKPSSNLYKALQIIEACGARAGGVTHLHGSDIEIKSDKVIVHIRKGYEKGGRQRDIEVVNGRHMDTLAAMRNKYGDKLIIEHRGHALQPESVEKSLSRAINKLGLSEKYNYQKCHSIRKMWAQERYNDYRADHAKFETIQYINDQLGHGKDRDVALLGCYVSDIY